MVPNYNGQHSQGVYCHRESTHDALLQRYGLGSELLSKMLPDTSFPDRINKRFADAVLSRCRHMAIFVIENFANLIFGKHGGAIFTANSDGGRLEPTLAQSIQHVFLMRAAKKMIGTDAFWIIAMVANIKTFCDWSIMQFPRIAMGIEMLFRRYIELSVSIGLSKPLPLPASKTVFFYEPPKPFNGVFSVTRNGVAALAGTGLAFAVFDIPGSLLKYAAAYGADYTNLWQCEPPEFALSGAVGVCALAASL